MTGISCDYVNSGKNQLTTFVGGKKVLNYCGAPATKFFYSQLYVDKHMARCETHVSQLLLEIGKEISKEEYMVSQVLET